MQKCMEFSLIKRISGWGLESQCKEVLKALRREGKSPRNLSHGFSTSLACR